MKQLITTVVISMVLIININGGNAADTKSDSKLKAFNNSVSAETIGNYTEAIRYMNGIFENFKSDYLVNLRLGWLNYLNKDYNQSIKYYKEAMRLSSNSIESLLGIVYPYYAAGKMDELVETYKMILDIDPHNYTANLNLGQVYFNKANYLNAKLQFEKIYNDFPSDYSANIYLGWTYYYLGSKSEAKKLFIDALIVNPNDSSAIEGLNSTK